MQYATYMRTLQVKVCNSQEDKPLSLLVINVTCVVLCSHNSYVDINFCCLKSHHAFVN